MDNELESQLAVVVQSFTTGNWVVVGYIMYYAPDFSQGSKPAVQAVPLHSIQLVPLATFYNKLKKRRIRTQPACLRGTSAAQRSILYVLINLISDSGSG